MSYCSKVFLFLISLLICIRSYQQQEVLIDSLKTALAKAATTKEKAALLDNLSRTLMNINPQEADIYGNQLINFAEESRDRKIMIDAYRSNGLRYSYFVGQKDFINKSIESYNKALTIARQNKLEAEMGEFN